MSELPFGLRAYMPGEFERLHAAGSGILTASQIPALFGHSRFGGRYAVAAHISGRHAMEVADNPMTARGRRLEPIAAEMLAEEGYSVLRRPAGMYAAHPNFAGRFTASPDAVAVEIRDPDGERMIVEIKTVAELVYREKWQDGPPLEVELQHQAQFSCCADARLGVIAALVVGAFRLDLIVYRTERNNAAVKLIEDAARALLDLLDAGEMPEPDTHASAAAVLQALHPVDPAKVLTLPVDHEAGFRFEEWKEATRQRLEMQKAEQEHKAWFMALGADAARIMIGNDRRIEIKDVSRAGCTVKPTTFRQVRLIEASEGI